jgi:hypothetical protein
MTSDADDGFHEIQLNGKQLVFLGMATTIVSVVIFLCGVLVGRGVQPLEPVAEAANASALVDPARAPEPAPAPPPEPAPAAQPDPVPSTEPTPAPASADSGTAKPAGSEAAPAKEASASQPAPAPPAPSASTAAAAGPPPQPAQTASPNQAKPADRKAPEPRPAPAPRVAEAKPVEPVVEPNPKIGSAPVPPAAADSAAAAPAGGGAIAVQVAALSNRSDAEVIARRLSSKGYAAYVLAPPAGAKAIYKVRVGNYASADEAERVKRRLAQEEKLQPWVIR